MNKIYIILLILAAVSVNSFANENDSLKIISLDQVNIHTYKETNYQNTPVSMSSLSAKNIDQYQVHSIKDINGKIANFFIPDYGSAMSNAVYIRGVGSRNSGQSVALYLDNVPYLEKTAFDFELFDIDKIEVLRGSQGTLYGRNTMGGTVNIYTLSPLSYQGTRAALTYGNYGLLKANASHYLKLNNKLGLSLGGFYGQQNGFYTNDFTGKKVDDEKTAGVRAKLEWMLKPNLKLQYTTDFDHVNQGAFPYGLYNSATNTTGNPNFDGESSYIRNILNNSIAAKYTFDKIMLLASLSHQYFKDEMNMDQDFTPSSIFGVQQKQTQNMLNGEAVLKSNSTSKYQWLGGVNFFTQKLDMNVPVSFEEDGVQTMLQSQFPPNMTITNSTFDIPGQYNNGRNGAALFHQSTFNDLLTKGLSLTLGLRLDYEKVTLDYDANTFLDVDIRQGTQTVSQHLTADLNGNLDTTYLELLPKAALKYEWSRQNYLYASVSRGYKSGGFNVQMISDLVSQKLMSAMAPNPPAIDVKRSTIYQPEFSWNYELGIHNAFFNNKLKTGLTLFYMDISGLQLTEFITSGAGRRLTNAGTSTSKGAELAVNIDLGGGFDVDVNYGFADATFKRYTNIVSIGGVSTQVDYAGKSIPYAPQNTVGVNLNYSKRLRNGFFTEIYGTASYYGAGKIYWTDANDISEDYYSLVNAKIGVKKEAFGLELWGKNLLNTEYNAFYFKSFGNSFFQKGKPLQFGVKLTLEI